jgi:hypothetical protein
MKFAAGLQMINGLRFAILRKLSHYFLQHFVQKHFRSQSQQKIKIILPEELFI